MLIAKLSIFYGLVWFDKFLFSSLKRRLPTPRPGQVLGLVGTNGIGKSTALNILAGKLKPNLGKFNVNIWIIDYRNFFRKPIFKKNESGSARLV